MSAFGAFRLLQPHSTERRKGIGQSRKPVGGMSMADDSNVRSARYANHSDGEINKASERPSGDPLAELARLIGQNDLFDQMRKDAVQAEQRVSSRRPVNDDAGPAPDWLSTSRRSSSEGNDGAQRARSYPHGDPLAAEDAQPARAESHADDPGYGAGDEEYRHDSRDADRPSAHAAAYDQHAAYEQSYAGADAAAYEPDPYQADANYEEADEHPLRERRRGGLITIAAVLGLAVVGTAGAFGYRAITGSSSGTTPPVIKADSTPAKVAPSPASNDAQGAKLVYDRADKPQPERVVSREEQPLETPRSAGPKMVTTSTITTPGSPALPPQAAAAFAAASSAAAPAATEPKKVKTFPIRPDGTMGTDASASRSPAPPTRVAAAQPGDATRGVAAAPTRTAAIPIPTPAPAAVATSAPTRTASIPTATAAAPSVTASAPPAGAYVVQLVSNKSEAEAQSAFKTLQAKYPSVLGNRTALIRRVELGDKGTYYRAQVGPFTNADQASALCDNLKAAGGQCIVQRN